MKRGLRNSLVQVGLSAAFVLLLIQIVLVAPSRIRDHETKASILPTPDLGADNGVDQSMRGMHMIETQDGGKEWELWADRAQSVKSKDRLELESVRAVFFSDTGATFTVTGEKGFVNTNSKNLRVEGNVVTRSSNGYVFRTQTLEYNSMARALAAPDDVEMLGPHDVKGRSLRLKGVGMKAYLPKASMEILSQVRARKSLESDRKAFIRSQRSIFSGKDRTARFLGDVVLDLDAMRITGPEADFQYDSKRDLVRSVQFKGGARVSDAEKWATADNVTIDFDQNKFVFNGNPRVVQDSDELLGHEIIFYDGGKRVQVIKARAKVDEKRLEKKSE